MRFLKINFSLIGVLLLTSIAIAQNKKEDKELFQEASKLNNQAAKLWNKGERSEAEKLFFKAHDIYYVVNGLRLLADYKMSDGDINGANRCFDMVIKKLESYKGQVMIYNIGTGWSSSYVYTPTHDIIVTVWGNKAAANYQKGDMDIALKSYRVYFDMGGDEAVLPAAYNAAFYGDDKEALKGFMKDLEKSSSKNKKHLKFADAFLDILNKDYTTAINKLLIIEDDGGGFAYSKFFARHTLAIAYALNKEPEKSDAEVKQMLKDPIIGKRFPFIAYIRGLNELTRGNYDKAIEYFDDEIKPNKGIYARGNVALFRSYAARAEAYLGKKDFIKAREDFETALLYKSNYEVAENGIAKLEGKVLQERKIDKTPPVIQLTEPAASRGLQVTASAGQDVMFRGTAKDPSGLKTVMINNTSVYVQENGNFWGTVPLKAGINQVLIKATDIAGNIAEVEFKIEHKAADKEDDIVPVVAKESKNFALIIASQSYDDPTIPSLENPVTDAVKLKLALKKNYSFADDNILTLFNPTVNDLKKKFADLMEFVQPEDNVIIFYAGHGIWVEKEKKGYWLLSDAQRNDANTWLSNKLVLDLISKIPSRHTLLITDACFSGSVFKTRSLGADAPKAIREMSEKVSRVAITSGNDTEVPDESVFMKYLVKALSENKDKYLTAQKMFITQIIEAVMTETKTEPRYGTLELAGHVGGDFIFVKK